MKITRPTTWLPCGVVLVAIAVRIPLLLAYGPMLAPDSGTYLQAARDLLSGDFAVGMGRRTPGYPLLLLLAGLSPTMVLATQLLCGVATSWLLYVLGSRLSGSLALGAAAGLAHALSLQQMFAETAVLTEAFSTFSVVAALALLYQAIRYARLQRPMAALMLGVGVLCALALFVRPQFICLLAVAPLAVLAAVPRLKGWLLRGTGLSVLMLAPAMGLVLAWCAIVQAKTGYFTMSTQSGFGLMNHAVDFMEVAPDRYAKVRDIMVRVRERRIAEVGHARNTIWYAWPEIQQATGWSLPEASRQFQAMCREMFLAQPVTYAKSVGRAWVDFWTVPVFWAPERMHPAVLTTLEAIWWIEHKLLRAANLVFVLMAAGMMALSAFRRRLGSSYLPIVAISAVILMSSLIQAMADQGASSRYHLPTQSLAVLVVLVSVAAVRRPVVPVER